MNIKTLSPTLLSLIVTHQCTSACPNCCFACSPNVSKHTMSEQEMVHYIDEAYAAFPSLKTLVLTGGECTILGQNLVNIVNYANKKGFITRIVTNAHWAANNANGNIFIKQLANVGLDEINISTGDEHLKFVSLDTIMYAISICSQINSIKHIVVNIESSNNPIFTIDDFNQHPAYMSLDAILKRKILVIKGTWIEFRKNKNKQEPNNISILGNKIACSNLLNSVTINPYGQVLACCGFAAEYSPFLKLGSCKQHSIKKLINSRFNDILKMWLATSGPYEVLCQLGNKPISENSHICEYCLNLLT